jgi:hypothetical protein
MNTSKKRYDLKHKLTRIHLSDYLILKRMSYVAGVSMAEALHRLIEHQAQLPLLDMAVKPISTIGVTGVPTIGVTGISAIRVAPVTTIATNGSKGAAFRIQPKGVRHD